MDSDGAFCIWGAAVVGGSSTFRSVAFCLSDGVPLAKGIYAAKRSGFFGEVLFTLKELRAGALGVAAGEHFLFKSAGAGRAMEDCSKKYGGQLARATAYP